MSDVCCLGDVDLFTFQRQVVTEFHGEMSAKDAGTTSGFGRRLVTSILARGDCVIATGRSLDKLGDLHLNCSESVRKNLRTLQLDVTEGEASLKTKAEKAAAFWGHIDVLVNNAGWLRCQHTILLDACIDVIR